MTPIRSLLGVALVLLALSLPAGPVGGHEPKFRVYNSYYTPAPVPVVVQNNYYAPPAHVPHFGPAPVTYPGFRDPVPVTTFHTPSYSFYQPGRVGVYVPPAPYSSTTTTLQKGILFPRVHTNTTTYYTPGYFRY
jgi:hypothetical protein